MSLVKDWRDAKRRYDDAYKQALRKLKPLEAQLAASAFYLEAQSDGKLGDAVHMRRIRTYLDDFTPQTILQTRRDLEREVSALQAIDARPFTGLEQAFNDLERVLGAAEQLIAKAQVSPGRWNEYRQIYEEASRRLMGGNDKFEAFISKRANMEAKLALRLDHASLLKQVARRSRAVYEYLQEHQITG